MNRVLTAALVFLTLLPALPAIAQDARIEVRAGTVLHPVSRFLTGACLEDVNHEVYGGIDSQMLFGESFAEPEPPPQWEGFTAFGGCWTPVEGALSAAAGDGPKLIRDEPPFRDGEVGVEVWFPEHRSGNAGLIVRVNQPGAGADRFTGYEVALDTAGRLILGRHRQNWEPIRELPCEVPVRQWIPLRVRMSGDAVEVLVNGRSVTRYKDAEHPLGAGTFGLRTWQREARFRNLALERDGRAELVPFVRADADGCGGGVSGMWRVLRRGSATGAFALAGADAFSGMQSQRIEFAGGAGEVGIENRGLNRRGLHLVRRSVYDGLVCVRAAAATDLFVALESGDGASLLAEQRLRVAAGGWQRLDFRLKPRQTEPAGRLALKLKAPGAVEVGYAFLQPGPWGRFRGLPVRRDVAEALIGQGITVLRLGGCMVNAAEYRWKKMIGPRERRPPYAGWWYPHSSNGWGIFDFLNFCEAAGFLGIPAVNMGESPEDMADFIEYVNGPADSPWGRRRASDGHPAPYRLRHLQLGNEERVDEAYAARFEALAKAIWARDPEIILVVGDFAYSQPITDPEAVRGAVSGITRLVGQQRVLELARRHDREVWFDVHVGTEGPRPDVTLAGMFSFRDALGRIAGGARHRVVVFEFNAGNHAQRRALPNALGIQAIERDGGIPVVTSANCLQPEGQNDNGWDQGLLFLNPATVWLQPPGYVTQIYARHHLPEAVACVVTGPGEGLDAVARRSRDGREVTLLVVNPTECAVSAVVAMGDFVPRRATAIVTELAGSLDARNTAVAPDAIRPREHRWRHGLREGDGRYTFPAWSVTGMRFE